MFKVPPFFVSFFIAGISAHTTVDVLFYNAENCTTSVGAICTALKPDLCCGSPSYLWSSILAENFQDAASGTQVRVYRPNGGNICGILIFDVQQGQCLVTGQTGVISAAAFENGTKRRRRGAAAAEGGCTDVQPIDAYFYQPGDGFRYIIDAKNSTHAAAFDAATDSDERAEYIAANFDKKVAVGAYREVTIRFSG
ncbi:hypothetical protein CPB84DRAFT_316258 [Gymnopilus junonius]|uniref:Uncharacterized protein n=1 Tax=Gymnopilus junonius TaxID=109634 RepID=A0A9P5TI64_GYMJU|nr:hypothetical protein CPB84DRAFT_316258 [Gymnopilus junonius]